MPKVLRNMGFATEGDSGSNKIIIPDDTDFVPFSPKNIGDDNEEEFEEVIESPIDKATREANEILQRAENDARQIVLDATRQADDIKKAAQLSGYDEAFQSQIDTISATLTNAVSVLDKITRAQNSFIEKYEIEMGKFAIEIARTILKHQIEIDPLALCDMAEEAVAEIKEAKWAVLNLSKELVPLVELLQSELPEKCPSIANLEVVGRDVDKGSCFIDTPQGILDASIEEQLRNLAQRFEQIKQKRGTM